MRVDPSVRQYEENFAQVYHNAKVRVQTSGRDQFRIYINGDFVSSMSRLGLEAAARAMVAPAPRAPKPWRIPLGSFAKLAA